MLKQMSHWFAHFTQVTPKPPKEAKPKQNTDDLQSGFAYIKANGPRTRSSGRKLKPGGQTVHFTVGQLGWYL